MLRRWCNQDLSDDSPPAVLATGLADFLAENQAQAIDAGLQSPAQLLDLDKYKYYGHHHRRTNLSLIYVEFPSASGLWEALQELLKRAPRLFLWQAVRILYNGLSPGRCGTTSASPRRSGSHSGRVAHLSKSLPTSELRYYIALKFQLQLKERLLGPTDLQ